MHNPQCTHRWLRGGLSAVAVLCLLAACGGGDDAPGSSAAPPAGKAVDEGEIQGFGSVIVNGTHYETGQAEILVDGQPAGEADLQLGMVVRVEVDADGLGRDRSRARRILFHSALQGPIQAIEGTTLDVLGYGIATDQLTRFFDAAGEPAALEDFAVGDRVRVSGFRRADTGIAATFVRAAPDGSDENVVRGRIADLDPDALRFRLYGVPVDYAGASLIETRDRLENGDFVEVAGRRSADGERFEADRVTELRDRPDADHDDRPAHGSVQGTVGAVDADSACPALAFSVDDQRVRVTSDTQYRNGRCADIETGRRVVAVGRFADDGTLVARGLAFPERINAILRARVEDIVRGPATTTDASAPSCTLRVLDDLYIAVDDHTRQAPPPSTSRDTRRGFGCDDVRVGAFVYAIGHFDDDGDRDVVRARLLAPADGPRTQDTGPSGDDSLVAGEVQRIDPVTQQFEVLGTLVQTDENTTFRESSAAGFYTTTQAGDLAGALGPWTGSLIQARMAGAFDEDQMPQR